MGVLRFRRLHNRTTPWGVSCAVAAALLAGDSAYGQTSKAGKPAPPRRTSTAPAAVEADAVRAAADAPPAAGIGNVYRHLLNSTVLIVVSDPETESIGTGTGWIVDVERRLVVTNQHVVETQPTARCVFPKFNGTKLLTNIQGYPESDAVAAKVLDSDPNFDLALIQVDSLPEQARAVRVSTRDVSPGEKVHTIAGLPQGTDGMWVYGTGAVRQISEGRLANGSTTWLMESDIPINQGNSGAAVIDDAGEVVAVAEGFMTQVRGTSLCVAAESVREYLDIVLPLVDPQTAKDWGTVGSRAYEQGRSDAAMHAYTTALELDEKLPELHIGRGLLLLDAEDPETALADFTTALQHDPRSIDALRGRAQCQELMGDSDAALADLTKAIQKNPRNAAIYNERGCLRTRLDDYEKAEADFNRAIDLDPQEPLYLVNRCIARRSLGNVQGALADIAKVCQSHPDNVDAVNEFGLTLYDNEQYKDAAEIFEAARQIDRTNPIYPQNLGDAYQAQEQHELALQAYQASLELEQENPYVWYSIGWSQHELAQYGAAVESYQQALNGDPDYLEVWEALVETHKAMGNHAAAREAQKQVRRLKEE